MERPKASLPDIADQNLNKVVRANRIWAMGGEFSQSEIELSYKVVETAQEIFLPILQREGKTGAILVISQRREGAAILYVQIGEIDSPDSEYNGGKRTKYVDFARGKVEFLQENQDFVTRSSRNPGGANEKRTKLSGKVIPGGAVAFRNFIIGVSGLSNDPKVDEKAVLEIGNRLNLKEDWYIWP